MLFHTWPTAVRPVLTVAKTDHISPHLAYLYWLPIDLRIQCKFTSLCYNCVSSTSPGHLTELKLYKPTRGLRSSFSDTCILCLHSMRMHALA